MNNEEKILGMLEQVVGRLDKVDSRLDKLEQGQADTTARLDKMQEDIKIIKEDIDIIKEDGAITRGATNALVKWVEQAEVQIRIPFIRKAE